METSQPVHEAPAKTNRTLLIIVASTIAVCCFCIVVGAVGYLGFITIRTEDAPVVPIEEFATLSPEILKHQSLIPLWTILLRVDWETTSSVRIPGKWSPRLPSARVATSLLARIQLSKYCSSRMLMVSGWKNGRWFANLAIHTRLKSNIFSMPQARHSISDHCPNANKLDVQTRVFNVHIQTHDLIHPLMGGVVM